MNKDASLADSQTTMILCAGCHALGIDADEIRKCARCSRQVAVCRECDEGGLRATCEACRQRPAGW